MPKSLSKLVQKESSMVDNLQRNSLLNMYLEFLIGHLDDRF